MMAKAGLADHLRPSLSRPWPDTKPLGFQPPLKQWVLRPRLLNPKGFNHRNWVNHYFNGGGSPGKQYYTKLFAAIITSIIPLPFCYLSIPQLVFSSLYIAIAAIRTPATPAPAHSFANIDPQNIPRTGMPGCSGIET